MGKEPTLSPLSIEDLARSGIDEDAATTAGVYSLDDASSLLAEYRASFCTVFPYFGLDGTEMEGFSRIRYLKPTHKKRRYAQPANSGVRVYLPKVKDFAWEDVAKNVDIPVIITEGEKKALKLSSCAAPCIGLGGVYNYTVENKLAPEISAINLRGRAVYICFDSDRVSNPHVLCAEARLSAKLYEAGAKVHVVELPTSGESKVGADDYIVTFGVDKFYELLKQTLKISAMDSAVLKMNRDVAYIEARDVVMDMSTDTRMTRQAFCSGSRFSVEMVPGVDTNSNKMKLRQVARVWLTHKLARRYTSTIFSPDNAAREIISDNGGILLNLFKPLESKKGDVAPFFKLYNHIMSQTDSLEMPNDFVWKIIAYKAQNLAKKVPLALVLIGSPGGGKNLFSESILGMFEPYTKILNTDNFLTINNSWLETALAAQVNEVKGGSLLKAMDKLKTWVTDSRQNLSEKYEVEKDAETYALFILNSNERSAGAFDDDDRRMVVLHIPDTHPDKDSFYRPIVEWKLAGGPKALLHYAMNYDLKGWEPPHRAPATREKLMAAEAAKTPVERVASMIRTQAFSEGAVLTWIKQAQAWAAGYEPATSREAALVSEVVKMTATMQIRPWYTPDEIKVLFPSMAAFLIDGKIQSPNRLMKTLLQAGVSYLKNKDDLRGFDWDGRIRQYFIVADAEKYRQPISYEDFEKVMRTAPTYAGVLRALRS